MSDPEENFRSRCRLGSGSASCAVFSITEVCCTVSNALVKSKVNMWTYWSVDNFVRTVWMSAMRAATVDPVGLKAN